MIAYISWFEGKCNLFSLEQSFNSILSRDVLKDQVTKSFDKKPCLYTLFRWRKFVAITSLHGEASAEKAELLRMQ